MNLKQIKRNLRHTIGRIILRITRKIVWVSPERLIYFFSNNLSQVLYLISTRHRKIALNNLKIVFPDKTLSELYRISKQSFKNIARSIVEVLWLSTKSKEFQKKFYCIKGKEHLDEALKLKRGIIGVIAHFGNFPFLVRILVLEGYKVNLVIRKMRDKKMNPIVEDMLLKQGINYIFTKPERICVRESLRVLGENQLLILGIDQDVGKDGIFVDFFGKPTPTPIGPAVFFLRNKAPIVPIFIIREKKNFHKVMIEPSLKFEDLSFSQENIYRIIQKISRVIERYIKEYPSEWGWIGRRWRIR